MPVIGGVLLPDTKLVRGVIISAAFSTESIIKAMDLKPESGDIILSSFPKCGTNWVKQILMLLKKNGVPPTQFNEYMKWCPYLENTGPEILIHQQPPRCYYFHFDYQHVPKSAKAKYICVIRNPKDCLISLYHFLNSSLYGFEGGDFNVLFNLFIKGQVIYNDYFDHILSWYERRNDTNVLFLYYEKMKADIQTTIKKIAKFLGPKYEESIKDENVLNDILKYTSFDYMKVTTNTFMRKGFAFKSEEAIAEVPKEDEDIILKGVGPPGEIVRKGIVGDWRNVLTSEQSNQLDAIIEKRLKGTEMYDYWKSIGCI